MRFGSVCSGIEAASVAWHPLGWQAAWLSEIEPFPSAVLAHHYPDVPNLGDMTALPERILSGEVEAPDLFCGGTPCQAFSVAGLRNSLDDARGNLSLTFVGIANAIDHVRSVRGNKPAIIFWENVPGVLSTKDNAFGCFLGALAGEDEPLQPAGGKWTDAGVVLGPQRAVAWRILDAQYFSLAQRRRRVFVISSARDDFDPAAVLFEWEGVRRDSAPSRETGKAVAPRTGSGFEGGICGSLTARFGGNAMGAPEVDAGLYIPMSQPIAWDEELNASIDQAGTILRGGAGGRHDGVMQPIGVPEVMATLLSSTAGIARTGNAVTEHETYIPMAAQPVAQPIHYRKSRRAQSTTDHETWVEDDAANTLNCFDVGDIRATDVVVQPVAQPMVLMDQGGSVMNVEHDMVGTLRRETHGHEPVVMQPIAFHPTQDPISSTEVCHSIGANENATAAVMQPIPLDLRNAGRDPEKHDEMNRQGVGVGTPGEPAHTVTSAFVHGVAQPVAVGTDCYNGSITGDVAATMGTPGSSVNASGPTVMQPVAAMAFTDIGQGQRIRPIDATSETLRATKRGPYSDYYQTTMQVRRLTPVECERLQGFPDNYTAIPWRKKPASECPDGPRYKALGNSWAVPNVRWIGQRIAEQLKVKP